MRSLPLILAALLCAPPALAQTATTGVRGNLSDGSGTLTVGGTSQQVFLANPGRYYVSCQNPITATETLFVNFNAAASTSAGSYELAAGGSITFDNNFIPAGTVNVNAATTGHRFICKAAG